ncbi:Flotillin-1 [Blattella germanica]|nr:Flotillin-1 [Blattella germanica]
MTWGFVTCGPNEALVVSESLSCNWSDSTLIVCKPAAGERATDRPQKQRRFDDPIISHLALTTTTRILNLSANKCVSTHSVADGCCYNKPLLVPGGRAFVWPTIQCVQRISLNTMTLQVESPTVYTSQGVPISVTGIAQVKIQGQNEEMLLAACEQFLGKQEHEIQHIALEIYKDRKKFSKQVFEVASSDLVNMGITVVSYTLKDIRDEEGYLKSLGMARTAEVKRDAQIAKAQRDFELKKAAYDVEVQTKKAEAELAYELQAAKTKQRIKEEQMQILVVERSQEIAVQDQEIQRKERELEATIRRPAEAEKYKLEKLAEANRNRVILEAEAEAEALRVRGEAEAFAIEAKARAEAEQMAKKADAWKDYKEAAMVAAEVAAPLSQAKKITMVSSGQGEIGAAKLTGEVLNIVSKLISVIEKYVLNIAFLILSKPFNIFLIAQFEVAYSIEMSILIPHLQNEE